MYGYGYQYGKIDSGVSIGAELFNAYKLRVLADGGVVENKSCTIAFLDSLNPYDGNLLLGLYPNAAAAYSLRQLNPTYTGSAIRVRRSSDNAEQDIALVGGVLDTSSLLTFTGVGDGLVPIVYDQSTNANNFAQTTAANQLKIVDAGALVTSNSLAATQGIITTGGQTPSIAFSGMTDIWFFAAVDVTNTTNVQVLYESSVSTSSNNGAFIIYISGGKLIIANKNTSGVSISNEYLISTDRQLLSMRLRTGVDKDSFSELYINGTQISASTTSGAGNTSFIDEILYVGARAGTSLGFLGKRQESIFYPTDQSSNRVAIETNINAYYGIY